MMEQPTVLFSILAFIAVLGPLVFFHELGHYGVARLFGVKSEAFSIGFGREILGWTDKRGTRWKVGWLPLGGYVKFAGDMDPASRRDPEDRDPDHFQNRPVWQRFLIVLAGPMANFLLAIAIFAAFFMALGQAQSADNRIGGIQEGSAAQAAGLQAGDRILSIGGRDTPDFDALTRVVILRPGEEVAIRFERGGRERSVEATITAAREQDVYGDTHRIGRLGVTQALPERVRLNPIEAIGAGAVRTWQMLDWIIDGLGRLIFGNLSIKELGGPIKIAQVSGQQAQLGWESAVAFAALLSINLGFINLLPVPMLDGGHLLFYAIEAVRKRPVSPAMQEWAFRGGVALILALVVFTTINDSVSVGLVERIGRLIG